MTQIKNKKDQRRSACTSGISVLYNRGEDPDKADEEELLHLFTRHVQQVREWLDAQQHMAVLDIPYNRVLQDPRSYAAKVNAFLGGWLDEDAMVGVVDRRLYRNRVRESDASD